MAGNKTGVYDFSKTIVTIRHPLYDGIVKIDGFMNDTTINVQRDDPRWTRNSSGDGKASTLVRNPINDGTISFTLNQSTDGLAKMNAIAQHANVSDGQDIMFEITVADKSSGSIHYCRDAIVGEPESVEYGREENGREWTIQCGELINNLNGAAKMPRETLAFIQALGFSVDETRVAAY